jgi:hypothetical protein
MRRRFAWARERRVVGFNVAHGFVSGRRMRFAYPPYKLRRLRG